MGKGALTSGEVEYGQLSADAGHAEIYGKARSGEKSLRILGGADRTVSITFKEKLAKDTRFSFWAERWTGRAPFQVKVYAITAGGTHEVISLDKVGMGSIDTKVEGTLPAGATAMQWVTNTPDGAGLLVDDLVLLVGEMKVQGVEVVNPGPYPIMKRAVYNPAAAISVQTAGADKAKKFNKLSFTVTNPSYISRIILRSGDAGGMNFNGSVEYGSAKVSKDGNTFKFDLCIG
jgi:hypothetical protein